MSRILLQGVRLIDPFNGVDLEDSDLLLEDGVLKQVGAEIKLPRGGTAVRRAGSVVAPSFLDLHCHLREPGQPWKERIARATAAASAGGFGAVCAMANLTPPVDTVERLRRCQRHNKAWGKVPVLQFAACTKDIAGVDLADLEALARGGAVGFSDDGRHGMAAERLQEVLTRAAALDLVVAIHPEDEELLKRANRGSEDPSQWHIRPPGAELSAIQTAISVLRDTPGARLHLQHVSTAGGVDLLRQAKKEGLSVTAEVTPHHLMLTGAAGDAGPADPARCNPPLRTEADRMALWGALLEGTIDAIASDHAPHEAAPPSERLPGFSGIQLVLSAVLGQGGALSHLGRVVETLTAGPRRVLGQAGAAAPGDGIRSGEAASLTWFDPNQSWTPSPQSWLSLGTNTPFWGEPLKGTVLATFAGGRMVHLNRELVPELDGD
ncbi:MAG TPA: dihydroorotase [Candidatus Dormibacteraeota bacterium]|nr:dihydroorotase [Candidatus Dormibacteraeota bacterium]